MSKDGIKEGNRIPNAGSTIGERTFSPDDLDVEDRFTPVAFRVLGVDSPDEARGDAGSAAATPD